jgi:hypothetical protein
MAASKKPAAPKRLASKAPAKKTPPKSQSQTAKNFWPKDVNASAGKNGEWTAKLPRLKSGPNVMMSDGMILSDGNRGPQTQWGLDKTSSRQGAISQARTLKQNAYKTYGTTKPPTKRGGKK